jgi:hypothetical protein
MWLQEPDAQAEDLMYHITLLIILALSCAFQLYCFVEKLGLSTFVCFSFTKEDTSSVPWVLVTVSISFT